MASVTFEDATRIFHGASTPAVDKMSLEIADGECMVLVGPSGCGKSTSLRMVAGLEPVTSGRIFIGSDDMTGVRPRSRDVAMVFQSYALYPTMSVRQNIAFALENAKVPRAEIRERVDRAAQMLQLTDLLDRKPGALSGGQRQRVAMGRAIVRKPRVFCMDEPLSNLDAKLRVSMRGEIAALQRDLAVTTVYVTHDQVEAMTMGHRVAVMNEGKLQQVATPEHLYRHPANVFVASFIGSPAMTLLTCPLSDEGAATLSDLAIPVPAVARREAREDIIVGVRPESWQIVAASEPGIDLVTDYVERLGAQTFVYGTIPKATVSHTPDRIAVLVDRRLQPAPGDILRVSPQAGEIHFFDVITERALA